MNSFAPSRLCVKSSLEELSTIAVDCGFKIHQSLGPGLLESVYETVLSKSLEKRGLRVERQKPVSFTFDGLSFDDGFRADILIESCLLVELKSTERAAPVHAKQLLTYLRLMKLPLGLLMNFGGATFKEGVQRVVNGHDNFAPTTLCGIE